MEVFTFKKAAVTPESLAALISVNATDIEIRSTSKMIEIAYKGSPKLTASQKTAAKNLIEAAGYVLV